jgi:hypothetical protein
MGKFNLILVVLLALIIGTSLSSLNTNLTRISDSLDHSLLKMQSRLLGGYALTYGIQKLDLGEVMMLGGVQTWHTPQFAIGFGQIDSIRYVPVAGDTVEVIPYIKNWITGGSVASSKRALIDFFVTQPDGQFGYYTMEEGSGDSVADNSDFGFDGSLLNMDNDAWVSGTSGFALNFDGADDYMYLGEDISQEQEADLTVAAWFKTTSTQPVDWGNIISENSDDMGNQLNGYTLRAKYKLVGPTNVEFWFEVITDVGRESVYLQVFGTHINLTEWHFVAGVLDLTAQTIMVGVVDANIWAINSINGTSLPEKAATSNITVGHIAGGPDNEGKKSGFKGHLDSLHLISDTMTINQLIQLMLYDGIKQPKLLEWRS